MLDPIFTFGVRVGVASSAVTAGAWLAALSIPPPFRWVAGTGAALISVALLGLMLPQPQRTENR